MKEENLMVEKKDNLVFIESYKGYDIYFDKDTERFHAAKPELDIAFEAFKLWEIKGIIGDSFIEEVNKEGIIKSGYFNRTLAKVLILTRNKVTDNVKYKMLDETEKSYEIGRIQESTSYMIIYPLSKENLEIWDKIKKLEDQIDILENQQKSLVDKIKR